MTKLSLSLLGAASAVALCAAEAGDINGRVTDSSGEVPLRAARVVVSETGQVTQTSRDGSFRLTGLDAGSYTLEVSYIGASTETVTVDLASADAISSVTIAMGDEDVVVVRGQLGSLNSALNQQRNADGVVTVLSADAIGQLPDENVAEAARRALGVSIANDQGEGRFISIRGINSQLNSTSVNGVRLTSPEAGDRRIGMDVIDADILKNIVINKTLSADMDGDAIGGSIDLETISGLDTNGMLAKLKLGTIYSELSEAYGEKVSGTYANNYMDGRFGVALSGSFQSREFGSENKEVDGGWNTEDGALPYPEEELEFRNYDITRERLSLAANFDFMATENTKLYLHSLYNDFSDQEYRNRLEIKIEDALIEDENGDFPGITFDGNTVTYLGGVDLIDEDGEDATTEFEIDRDLKDRLEEQRIYSVATGFEHQAGVWGIDGSIAFTHAEEEEPNRLDTNFDLGFDEAGDSISIDVSNPALPVAGAVPSTFADAGEFELDGIEFTDGLSEDDELAIAFNIKRDMMFGQNPGYIKAGVKTRNRDKSYDLDFREYSYEGDGAVLADYAITIDYPLDIFGPGIDAGPLRDFFFSNIDNPAILEEDEDVTFFESNLASYEAEEDIFAGYVMGQVDIDRLRITGGVRVEQTDVSAQANVVNEDTSTLEVINFDDDYTDVLPSIAFRYNATDKMVVRASYYASIIRPNFGQFVPSGETNDDDELVAGNPDLQRTEADNFDFLVEYYPSGSSIIQGGVFYKELENLIAGFESDVPGTFNGLAYEEIESFTNIDEATIFGVEIGYQQALDMLPAPFDGLIVGANYTYADSEATLPDGTEIRVPGQSEHVYNLIVGYDKGRWDLRAAYSFKGENIDDVDVDGVGEGRIIPDQDFLDLSAKFEITEQAKIYLDVKNVLDTPLEVVERSDGIDVLSQYEEYGYSVQAGVLFKF